MEYIFFSAALACALLPYHADDWADLLDAAAMFLMWELSTPFVYLRCVLSFSHLMHHLISPSEEVEIDAAAAEIS